MLPLPLLVLNSMWMLARACVVVDCFRLSRYYVFDDMHLVKHYLNQILDLSLG